MEAIMANWARYGFLDLVLPKKAGTRSKQIAVQ